MKQCCSDLLVIRKMQITTKVTYHFIIMASVDNFVEKWEKEFVEKQ